MIISNNSQKLFQIKKSCQLSQLYKWAAKRAGIHDIILCENNRKDVNEIKADYLKDLNFHFVSNMLEVLDIALLEEKVSGAMDMSVKEKEAAKA